MATAWQTVRDELQAAFEPFTRKNEPEKRCYRLREDAPPWLQGSDVMLAVHKALDDRFPDDWVYEQAAAVADALYDLDAEDEDAAREALHEIADGLVDVYNADRVKWLAQNLYNAALVDDAVGELGGGDEDTFTRIGYGQYMATERIGDALITAITDEAAEREDCDGELAESEAARALADGTMKIPAD